MDSASRSKNAQFKDTDDEMASLGLIIVEAMAGRDCSERFACEITKIFRGLKSSNKALRILEILLPPKFSQQISQIRKAAGKRAKCGYIPCKIKKEKPPPANNTIKVYKPKPWRGGKPTAHDLWMKNFEKKKSPPKQQSNQQQKKKN